MIKAVCARRKPCQHARLRLTIHDGYELDDDTSRVDVDALVTFLTTSAYWGRWRTRPDIEAQLASAWRLVGLYRDDAMVGFARAVSDGVAFGYLADVYVDPDHRGRGLGVAMVRELVEGNGADGFPRPTFRMIMGMTARHAGVADGEAHDHRHGCVAGK